MTSRNPSESTPDIPSEAVAARHGTRPATEPASTEGFLEALEPQLAKFRDSAARRESFALTKAVRLAPTLEVAEALLRGENVPPTRLDPEWRRAYGL